MNLGGHIPPVSFLWIVTTAKNSTAPEAGLPGRFFRHDAAISDKNSRSGIDKPTSECYTAFVM